jgi:hypothetical protein
VQRTLGMVLERSGRSERCHHCVADKLLDSSTGPNDFRSHRLVEAFEDGPRPLRILRTPESGRADNVGEYDCRQLPLLDRGSTVVPSRTARWAEIRSIGNRSATADTFDHEAILAATGCDR